MKKIFLICSLVIFCFGCQKDFDITEPPANSTPVSTPEIIDYAKKYTDAIPAEKFQKDFLANPDDFKDKTVRIIGDISYHKVDEAKDIEGKAEKRLYFVVADKTYPVACIVEEDFTDSEIGSQEKGRVFEGKVFAEYAEQIHLKPCKLLEE